MRFMIIVKATKDSFASSRRQIIRSWVNHDSITFIHHIL